MCKGVVKDNQGETVIGASVVVKGSTNGTITGLDGDFTLDNVKRGDVIQISYIGYVSQEVVWQGTPLNITLKEDSQTLEEVVVVGFGSQKKANLTGSVSQVKMDDVLGERPVTNVKNALQGSMPGLMVSGGASPGEAKSFNIRGTVSINGMNPLVLIDNVEGDIDLLNPEDIESVTVLKDAASSAIYGARLCCRCYPDYHQKSQERRKIQLELQRQFWLPDFYQQSQTSFP
ncbi:TonB-dependent receptor plug domain-containing protein [Phocaeicola vulgatus]|nr:TonB-dependent receptor plug domain-containing protein [Phocaeicola vulgatus]